MAWTKTATRISVIVMLLFGATLTDPFLTPASAQSLLLMWSRGPDVADWQRSLNEVRDDDIAVDGIFGPQTAGATREFQRAAGIQVDGIVGPQTRAAMRGGAAPTGDVLNRGDTGPAVRDLQAQLRGLKYWVGPVDGIFGTLTHQAVTAFQKVNGLPRTGRVDGAVRSALASPAAPRTTSTRPGLVVEVNEPQQVLLLVVDGAVDLVFNTSTGTEEPYTYEGREYLADTPNGEWRIYRQIDGWRQSNLGRLYRPKYFHEDGIAIHGYPNVPSYPASHGCVRVSMAAMDYLWPRLPIGTPVLVY
jgi:peptidoglycan hydrolase-like protein with peptidoglycan-binding domain